MGLQSFPAIWGSMSPILPTLPRDPPTHVMARAYRLWAPVYDVVCQPLFLTARVRAAGMAATLGRRILEIGVGTGLSLGDYGPGNEVSGIDLSPEMIGKALVRAAGLAHVRDLAVMDAHRLTFADAAFDVVVAQFVITLVESPETVLDEALRVTAPGGEIILVNHFRSEHGLAARFEHAIAPAAHRLGLRPDFPFARITDWIAAHPGTVLVSREAAGPFGCFSIVRIRRRAVPAQG